MRATLSTMKTSRIPSLIGVCSNDTARIAEAVNSAQERLILAGRDSGWWQGWVKVMFAITPTSRYITLPREFARIINMAVGSRPVYIRNEFYEVLPGGPGPVNANCADWCGTVEGYERGVFPTTIDLTTTNQILRLYVTDQLDLGTKILFEALDQNGNRVYSMEGINSVNGFYMTLNTPFADSTFQVSKILSVVKPITYGDILLYQVDETTGEEVLLSRYLASETNPAYRRYYITGANCTCGSITALAKQEFIPALRDTDPLIIANRPALEEMVQALRYYSQDVQTAQEMGEKHEKRAIRLMRQELDHHMGIEQPAVTIDSGMSTVTSFR